MTLLCSALTTLALCLNGQEIPADYKAFLAAKDALAAKNYAEAAAAVEPVWKQTPESPLVGEAAVLAARALVELRRGADAQSILMRYIAAVPQPAGALLLGKAAEAAGQRTIAAGAYQKVVYEYPLKDEADEAQTALLRLTTSDPAAVPPVMPAAVFHRAEALRRAGQGVRAKRELLDAAAGFAGIDHDLAIARAYTGDYNALAGLKIADPEADAERLYLMHAAARRSSQIEAAEAALRELNQHYPQSRWALEALVSWGNHYLIRNDVAAYEPLYRACADRFPSDPQAAYCHWKLAWAAWMRRDPGARKLLEAHAARFPDDEKTATALYFLGNYAALVQRFPLSYYATLARTKVHPAAVQRTDVFDASPVTRMRIERARQLDRAGFGDCAEFELRYAAKEQPYAAALELAEIASRRGAHDRALRYIKGLARGYLTLALEAAPQRFWRLAFPLPYAKAVLGQSRAHGLDPYMVAALIRQESEFDPNAVSAAKAYGLTQVLPSTGRMLSRRLGVRNFRASMLFEPELNLKIGTYYLRSVLDSNDGRWETALAAYNAGQTRVREWLTWYNYREPAEFIETIPFTETRTYVQVVLRNADVYRRLYSR